MNQIANGIKSIIKKPKLALGFTFVPDRYDDDAKKAANAPSAFKRQLVNDPKKTGKKPKISTGFTYVPDRYNDDVKKAAKAGQAWKDTENVKEPTK